MKIISQKINSCGRCKFWNPYRVVGGKGNKDSGVMIIGEGPGKSEVYQDEDDYPTTETNEVFVGESGGILNWGLRKVGLIDYKKRYEKAYFTNVIKCYPSNNLSLDSVDITAEHKKKCFPWLRGEIAKVKPKFVLLLGAHAFQAVSGNYNASILDCRGFWYWSEKYKFWYLPTLHPAYVSRNWGATSSFIHDLKRFKSAVDKGKVPEQKLGTKYTDIRTLKGAKNLFKKLMKVKRFSWDTETTSLKFWDPDEEIIGVSFCVKSGEAYWLPLIGQSELDEETKEIVRNRIWTDKDLKTIMAGLKKVMEESPSKKDGQNTKYDVNWMHSIGIKVQNVDWDVMQFHHLVDENTFSNLTYLTIYYDLYFPKYDDELKPHIKKVKGDDRYEFVPTDILGKYSCADSDAVFRISRKQRMRSNSRQRHLYRNQSYPLSKFLSKLERIGAMVDLGRITELEDAYQKKIDNETKKLCKLLKIKDFNVASNPQMQQMLFGTGKGSLGLKPVGRASSAGNYGTGKDSILFLKRNYAKQPRVIKILNYVQEIRQMRKMKSTYLTGYSKLADHNARLHTSYLSTGTVTGRPSSTAPNLMNIPRDPIFRNIFVSGKGRTLISADYSQIEARLMAWLANEFKLIKQFADPEFDIHDYNSAKVRGIDIKDVIKEQRDIDKAVTFGINYGRSNKSIADYYNLDLDFVTDFVDAYFREFRKIWRWRELQKQLSKKQGYLQNEVGRRRHFTGYEWLYSKEMKDVGLRDSYTDHDWFISNVESGMERQAINFPIQSLAHDFLTQRATLVERELKRLGLDAKPILEVYDCVVYECADEDLEEAELVIRNLLPLQRKKKSKKTGKKYKIDFSVELKVAANWS